MANNESGRNHKESRGKEVEVVRAFDETRRALCWKEGDVSESAREKEERKTLKTEKMVGQSEG